MNKSVLAVAASYILWGLLPMFWKLLAQVDSIYTLCSRILWSLVVSVIFILAMGKWKEASAALRDKTVRRRLLAAGLLISFNWGAFIWCVMNGRVLDCSLAYYINPIIAIVVGYAAFHEKLSVLQWYSVALAVIGVSIPAFRDGQVPILAILIGTSFAIYGAVKKKVDLRGDVTTFIETLFVSPAALAVIILMEAGGNGAISNGLLSGWSLLLLPAAGLVTYLPLLLYSQGVRGTPMSLSGILMYVNPTLQFLIGILFYKEKLTVSSIITFCFVWAALILFVSSGRKTAKETANLEIGVTQ
jgi:chloramphenicol-sensitive protein RarD